MAHLLITADDCGMSKGINAATVALHKKGMTHHASVLANFPATGHALELFRDDPALRVGAHLNLTEGKALTYSDPYVLTYPNVFFLSYARLIAHALAPTKDFLRAVENELDAQIRVLVTAGFQPAHLTTHMHFHLLPSLRRVVYQLAERFHVPWVREHRLARAAFPFNPFLEKNIQPVPDSPAYLSALLYMMPFEMKGQVAMIRSLPGTVELAVHPSLARDETFPAYASYPPRERVREMEYLERLMNALRE